MDVMVYEWTKKKGQIFNKRMPDKFLPLTWSTKWHALLWMHFANGITKILHQKMKSVSQIILRNINWE